MKKQRRKHSPEFKARVALEAFRGLKKVSEIVTEFEVHSVMVSNWKKEMLAHLPEVFGFLYLFAIIDWYSRKIVGWELSNTLDAEFCQRCLKRAILLNGLPEIMNTDQGCHFTATKWQEQLIDAGIKISMDGKGRWIDNVRIERFWRTVKYEDIYLQSYCSPNELEKGITRFMLRYNSVRPHASLDRLTLDEVYVEKLTKNVV